MRVPTHGTSAYKYERTNQTETRKTEKGVSKKKNAKITRGSFLSYVVITALAFVLLFRYSCITEMSTKLTGLKQEYDEVSSVAVAKEFELEQYVDLKKVEDVATNELGMRRPEKHQIVYVDMQNNDYTEKIDTSGGNGGFFAAISGAWQKVWEYFN